METGVENNLYQEGKEPSMQISSQTGNTKPLYRFLRGEPKCVGIVMLFLGSCFFMFAIPQRYDVTSLGYAPFWMGIMHIICGVLYILAERNITKKIVTASFAFSVISVLGSGTGALIFLKSVNTQSIFHSGYDEMYDQDAKHIHYNNPACSMEAVFLFHSLVSIVILITMSVFSRLALRSTHSQMLVVMRYPPSAE